MQEFIIPGRLPGFNQFDNASSGHWAKRHRLKKQAMDYVKWVIRASGVRPVKGKAEVRIVCCEANMTRDPSNVRAGAEKIILDALQEMKIIPNDNWKWLSDSPATVVLDRNNPRIEVEIRESEEVLK